MNTINFQFIGNFTFFFILPLNEELIIFNLLITIYYFDRNYWKINEL